MSKKIVLYDKMNLVEEHNINKGITGVMTIVNPMTGKVIFKNRNKIIIHGSSYTAQKHFPELSIPNTTINYNDVLGLDNNNSMSNINMERIVLFSVGTDGCGVDSHQVRHVDYAKWCAPESLIPFRYVNTSNDDVSREIYFGRKDDQATNMVSYFFKKFDSDPQWTQRYISDGAPVDYDVYNSNRNDEIESFVELKLKVSIDDCREYFDETTGINNAKINTISLLTAVPDYSDPNYTYYQDIRPLTKINFPNQLLSELNKGLDIIYHIYY